jgi:hypothetical protein
MLATGCSNRKEPTTESSPCKQQVAVVSASPVAGRGVEETMAVAAGTVGTTEAITATQILMWVLSRRCKCTI